jgi:hypothetical protein
MVGASGSITLPKETYVADNSKTDIGMLQPSLAPARRLENAAFAAA